MEVLADVFMAWTSPGLSGQRCSVEPRSLRRASRVLPHAHSDPQPCARPAMPARSRAGPSLLQRKPSISIGTTEPGSCSSQEEARALAGDWVLSSGGPRLVAWVSLAAIRYAQAPRAPGTGHRQS